MKVVSKYTAGIFINCLLTFNLGEVEQDGYELESPRMLYVFIMIFLFIFIFVLVKRKQIE